MTPFEVYCILMLDSVSVGAGIASAIFAVLTVNNWGEGDTRKDRIARWSAAATVLFFLLLMFVPSTKQVAMMYTMPAIINNEDVQALPADIVKLARQEIEKMLKD